MMSQRKVNQLGGNVEDDSICSFGVTSMAWQTLGALEGIQCLQSTKPVVVDTHRSKIDHFGQ